MPLRYPKENYWLGIQNKGFLKYDPMFFVPSQLFSCNQDNEAEVETGPPETRAIPAGPLPAPLVEQQARFPGSGHSHMEPLDVREVLVWTISLHFYWWEGAANSSFARPTPELQAHVCNLPIQNGHKGRTSLLTSIVRFWFAKPCSICTKRAP